MKKSSREKLNLFFSSFLVIGFIVCSYFFMNLTSRVSADAANLIRVAVFVLFGLIIFYATRVGEGVQVKRFSLIVLLVMVVPSLLIVLATMIENFPLHDTLVAVPEVMMIAGIAFGYGIPYTFVSGFEMAEETEQTEEEEAEVLTQGGIKEELASLDNEDVSEEDVQDLEALDGVEE